VRPLRQFPWQHLRKLRHAFRLVRNFQVALKLSRLEVERVDLNALEPLEVKRFHLDSDLVISLILKANRK
jgi:hypothetical protein